MFSGIKQFSIPVMCTFGVFLAQNYKNSHNKHIIFLDKFENVDLTFIKS